MYRGWYKGQRELGSAQVPWEFCLAEWNAQFLGDRAFRISEMEKKDLRWEARQFRAGKLWHRWDYPYAGGLDRFRRSADGLRAIHHRQLARLPHLGRLGQFAVGICVFLEAARGPGPTTQGVEGGLGQLAEARLQPGLHRAATGVDEHGRRAGRTGSRRRPGRRCSATTGRCWPTSAASPAASRARTTTSAPAKRSRSSSSSSTIRGKPCRAIANGRSACRSRRPGTRRFPLPTGEQERIPLRFELPAALPAGAYELTASVHFSNGETQKDTFTIHVLPRPSESGGQGEDRALRSEGRDRQAPVRPECALPEGGSRRRPVGLRRADRRQGSLDAGRAGPGRRPGARRAEGRRVRADREGAGKAASGFGWRSTACGRSSRACRTVRCWPASSVDHLRDWRGEATLLPPRLQYTTRPRYGPTVQWCGIDVTRLWRCGCRGNVASVLIEKPARGDFLPILDGGYGLQYSPLMEYREGKGMVLFCQMDVTGRTESEPAADALTRNMLELRVGVEAAAASQGNLRRRRRPARRISKPPACRSPPMPRKS